MPYKRLAVAAALLFAATYLKLFLPGFASDAVPAISSMLELEQVTIAVPEAWMSWLVWD